MSSKMYREIVDLYFKQPWLEQNESELLNLFDLAKSQEDREVIRSLLENFTFLDGNRLGFMLAAIAEWISSESQFSQDQTQIVATTFDSKPDSSQMILQLLKPHLVNREWGRVDQKNRIQKAVEDVHKLPNIVLVDEFCGSGKTLEGRIRFLRQAAAQKSKSMGREIDLRIKVCLVAGMETGLRLVKDMGVECYCPLSLTAGISGNFKDGERESAFELMRGLEESFLQNVNGNDLPSMGYGRAEALYALENSNVPNSVFPIFWWRYLKDGSAFEPLLSRCDEKYL